MEGDYKINLFIYQNFVCIVQYKSSEELTFDIYCLFDYYNTDNQKYEDSRCLLSMHCCKFNVYHIKFC